MTCYIRIRLFFIAAVGILCMCSCKSINYCNTDADVYYEFGDKSHYYSNRSDSFGIELYHGFIFYDQRARLSVKSLPKAIRSRFDDKRWATLFILQNRLSPCISTLQKLAATASDRHSAIIAEEEQSKGPFHMDSIIRYLRADNKGDTIFCSEKTFRKAGRLYRIAAFSFVGSWTTSKLDKPSFETCQSEIEGLVSGWKDEDYILTDISSNAPLLQVASRAFWKSKNNYLYPLEIIAHHSTGQHDINYHEAATTFNSFAGNYKSTLIDRDSISGKLVADTVPVPANLMLSDATRIIYDSARTKRILILNEAHTQPRNRRFLSELLDTLYSIGYKHLYVETLVNTDTDINSRRYPVQTSGYYSSEPNFGNALRRALQIGYQLHPYDNESSGTERERLQATVIADFIQKNKEAKVIVYCGHGHLDEEPADSMMGYFLQEKTGIDPFTIEQTKLIERGGKGYESGLYKFISAKKGFTTPQSPVENNKLWLPGDYANKYDMLVAIPRTNYTHDSISDWQFRYGEVQIDLKLDNPKYKGCLLQIFDGAELKSYPYWELIPLTNLVLRSNNHLTYYLPKGKKYTIYVTDRRRKIIFEQHILL